MQIQIDINVNFVDNGRVVNRCKKLTEKQESDLIETVCGDVADTLANNLRKYGCAVKITADAEVQK